MKSGVNLLEPSGPVQARKGITLPLPSTAVNYMEVGMLDEVLL